MCLYTDIHAELYTHAQDVDACGRSVQQPWCRGELNTPSAPLRHSWPQGCQSQLCPGALGVCCHLPVVIHFNVGVILGTSEKQQMKKNMCSVALLLCTRQLICTSGTRRRGWVTSTQQAWFPNVSVNRSRTAAISWHVYLKPLWLLKELP